jgi:hypothetical protein
MQSFVDPIANANGDAYRICNYKARTIPTNQQCADVLQRWLVFHYLDNEQSQDKVWRTLSHLAKHTPLDEDEELVA